MIDLPDDEAFQALPSHFNNNYDASMDFGALQEAADAGYAGMDFVGDFGLNPNAVADLDASGNQSFGDWVDELGIFSTSVADFQMDPQVGGEVSASATEQPSKSTSPFNY